MRDARLIHLLNLYFDGALTAAEKAELERMLTESEAARQLFWKEATLHALTHEAAKLKWAEQPEAARQAAMACSAEPAAATRSPSSWWPAWGWRWAWGLATASALALGLFWFFQLWLPTREVARLAHAVNTVWAEGTNGPVLGAPLRPGWLHLERGAAEIQFHGGARILFEAPAALELVSAQACSAQVGRFRVYVPEKARGFKMHSASLNLVDLGTEFGISLTPARPAEVHVFVGRVELKRTDRTSPTLQLEGGKAVRIEPGAFKTIATDPAGFLTEGDLAKRELPEVQRRYEAWRVAAGALSTDPAAILHYTFEDPQPWDQVLTNRAKNAPGASHGKIVGCQWTEGRWPGKKALQFKSGGDRVRLHLPQSMQAVSCLVWLRVDGLPNAFVHSIMTGDKEGPGTLRWTISQTGAIRMGIASQSTNAEASWAVGMSPPVVTPERLKRWLMLAVVCDGQKVHHYADGQLVWSGPVQGPEKLSFGWVELGNWVATREHPDFQFAKTREDSFFARNFTGCIDEVAVLSRPLAPEEVRRFFEAGRPVIPATVASRKPDAR